MFHTAPVGRYLVAVCTNIACMLAGAYELLEHAEERLGISAGGTTPDGLFTLEDAECLALCGNAPCVTVNWRYFGDVDPAGFDDLVDDLAAGRLASEVPPARHPQPGAAHRRPAGHRGHRPPGRAGRRAGRRRYRPGRPWLRRRYPSVTVTNPPRIVTRHLGLERSWTLETYLGADGYQGLRKALTLTPEEIHDQVNVANLLGRGGAGFEAGRKWGMLRKSEPVYLVVNGDESEPATFKDHMLIEEDPHQLIEGALICAYATRCDQVFLFIRGEFALGLERVSAALNEAYAYGAVGRDIFGSGWSIDVVVHPGAGAYICGEETALLESLEGKRGYPADQAPLLPRGHRPLRRPDDRQQRRDGGQPAVGHAQRRRRFRRARQRPLQGDQAHGPVGRRGPAAATTSWSSPRSPSAT